MVSCQLVEGEMYSCLYEKEKNKWKSAGRDSYSERKVRCRVAFHFLRRELQQFWETEEKQNTF